MSKMSKKSSKSRLEVIQIIEEWKWVEGYEGLYKISNFGRLRSHKKVKDGYDLSNKNQKGGYLTVVLKDKNGTCKTHRIHRLVAESFIGKIPDGYHVHHVDGDKQNNMVHNLQIVDGHKHLSDNAAENPDVYRGMNDYNKYERPRTIYMYTLSGDYLASFPNSKAAELVSGICGRNILQMANGDEFSKGHTRKQAGGYAWSFLHPGIYKLRGGD